MATVIITDGEQRSGLAITRSLGRAGHRCVLMSASGRSLAGASRYADLDVAVAPAALNSLAFANAVRGLCTDVRADLVVPVTEESVLALLPHRASIPAVIPFADLGTFQGICDKARVLEVAASVGIRVPRQRVVTCRSEIEGVDLGFDLPVILKPSRSVYTSDDGTRGKVSVSWIHSRDELQAGFDAYPDAAFPILMQEVIEGPGVGVFLFLHEGRVLARFAHRRMREKPPAGGVSVVRRSDPMNEVLLRQSLDLLAAMNWTGVAMVEFKVDERTGEGVLMEVNGRFWGSLQLAIDAGVDFPSLLADVALGAEVPPVLDYRPVVSRWEWGDVDHLIARWRDPAAGAGDRLRSLAGWVAGFTPRYRDEVFRWTDPGPFFRETGLWLADVARR